MRKHLLKTAILAILPLTVFAQSQELCEGDAVTTDDHYNAVVKQVFPDGFVKVVINNYVYNYKLNQLSKPISCLGSICAGDAVTTDDHFNAVVNQVFPDGFVKVILNGDVYNYKLNQLSKPISSLGSIRAGDAVTTDDHFNAVVKQVFPDGFVKVILNGDVYNYKLSQLSKPISSLGNIRTGDAVTTDDHFNAVVKQVFPDGFVKVIINGNVYDYQVGQLALYKKCSQTGGTNCRQ